MTTTKILSHEELEILRTIPTPTMANAIVSFKVRPFSAGYTAPPVRQIAPNLPQCIGYAVISRTIVGPFDPKSHPAFPRLDCYRYLDRADSAPKIAVVQDLSDRPDMGGFYGEVNDNVHRAPDVSVRSPIVVCATWMKWKRSDSPPGPPVSELRTIPPRWWIAEILSSPAECWSITAIPYCLISMGSFRFRTSLRLRFQKGSVKRKRETVR